MSAPRGKQRALGLASALLAASIPAAAAQMGATVRGEVVAADGSAPVEGARVELQGHGLTETSTTGAFRSDGVVPGGYSLRVTAVGYVPAVLQFAIRGDTTVTVQITSAGYRLDSVVVRARRVGVEGLVQDRVRDLACINAYFAAAWPKP